MSRKIHPAAELAAYKTGKLKSRAAKQDEDKYIRLAAEFDNYKKRTARQYSEIIKTANEELILEILGVVDDFERALVTLSKKNSDSESGECEDIMAGMKMIFEKLMATLKSRGVEPMDVLDQPFDPAFCEAVMQSPSDDKEDGTVIGIVSPGYLLNGKVIRHAKVIVAASKSK